jgi:hypothetical protein
MIFLGGAISRRSAENLCMHISRKEIDVAAGRRRNRADKSIIPSRHSVGSTDVVSSIAILSAAEIRHIPVTG